MKLSLVISQGKEQGKAIPITLPQFLIGRDPQCHLRPVSPLVSKRHCALLVKGDKAYVRDFGSTNGTFVNDEPVKGEVQLHDGDRLKIGPVMFGIHVEATATKKPAAKAPPKPVPAKAGGTSDDDIAAMLLDVESGEVATSPESGRLTPEDVPSGSTVVMPMPVVEPEDPQAGKPAEQKKPAPKSSGDTSSAAKGILDKYMRRGRER